nr:carbonic anhydrase [uncultured Cellulosilyticum sp.]
MKKFAFLFVLMSTLAFVGCGNTNTPAQPTEVTPSTTTETASTPNEAESLVVDTNVSTAEDALNLLKDGNARFVADDTEIINVSSAKRTELENGQSPYAVVISCSDSRVTPSHVFNAGLGELFEIRIAGNILDEYALGSVEYGVEHLGCPLLVVMGHESCGAVTAAFEAYEAKSEPEGAIGELVAAITPSVEAVNASSIEDASHTNVQATIETLKQNPVVAEAIESGKLQVVGAYYDLDGHVTFLD